MPTAFHGDHHEAENEYGWGETYGIFDLHKLGYDIKWYIYIYMIIIIIIL